MTKNIYEDTLFFEKYSQMNRSIYGLKGAGEWETFQRMLPSLENKRILDLGCGFGWHCKYAAENKALAVVGVDSSEKMLARAKKINDDPVIKYVNSTIENLNVSEGDFDVVISSLALHYIENFKQVCELVYAALKSGGEFVFSVEHPVFTAYGSQNWFTDDVGNLLHWPVDHYFEEGVRVSEFLDEKVIKYHKTLTTYLNDLLKSGFEINEVIEPIPSRKMLEEIKEMKDELRRPMMLIISAKRK